MKLSRRELLRLAGSTVWLTQPGCMIPRPEMRLLPSQAPLPTPFTVPLPVPPVAKPVKSDASADFYEFEVRPAVARILPGLDTAIWGYDGIFPGPTIEAHSGRRVSLLLKNRLSVPIVHHLHGGRTAPQSDGYPTDFILPENGFPASHMHDPLARVSHGEKEHLFENNQRAATLWYHDHRMDFTGAQVWRGLAGMYIIRDDEESRLPLPRGACEIPLIICDRSFAADGSLHYPSADPTLRSTPGVTHEFSGGVMGDVILVNGAPWPRLEVANVKYRFRILNASNARRYDLALDPLPPGGTAFVQIGSDGGLLAAPIAQRTLRIAPAERFDVVLDFSRFQPGTQVALSNRAATGPARNIMRFDIVRTSRDESTVPAVLSSIEKPEPRNAVTVRDFEFSYQRFGHEWMVNGKPFDPARMDARPKLDDTEIWRMKTDFSHPLHLHLVHFQVLSHSGRPGRYDAGWKDTLDLNPGEAAEILVRFSGYRGRYVFHCHNLEHEDMAMMANFEVV